MDTEQPREQKNSYTPLYYMINAGLGSLVNFPNKSSPQKTILLRVLERTDFLRKEKFLRLT